MRSEVRLVAICCLIVVGAAGRCAGAAGWERLSPEDARALLARTDLVIGEDTDARFSVWTGAKKGLTDKTAADGSAAWFKTQPDSWNLQWHWDHRVFTPGMHYVVHAVVKVRKLGATGEAFKGGVWDKNRRKPVIGTTPVAAGQVDGDAWMVWRMGSIVPAPGQYVWIGTSGKNHDNVPEVWLDRFVFAPDDSRPHEMKYRKLAASCPGQPTFALTAEKAASVTLGVAGLDRITLGLFASVTEGGAAEVRASYGRGDDTFGEPVVLATVNGFASPVLDLSSHAPAGWSKTTRVTFALASQKGYSTFAGVIVSPKRDGLGLRRVAWEPRRGGKSVDSVVLDEQTKADGLRLDFDRPRSALRRLVPDAPFAVRVGSSLRKYLYHTIDPAWLKPGAGDDARVDAARHEYEGLQLIPIPLGDAAIPRVRCTVQPFGGAQGGVPQVTINPVGYVETKDLGYPVEHVGWWPDPLMPDGQVALRPDRVQPVWVTVYAPVDARPGEHRTTICIEGGGHTVRVPLTVRVRAFTLPKETHLRSSFWLFRYHIRRFYGWDKVPWEVYKKYVDMATSHRLTPIEHSIEGGTEPYIKVHREPDGRLTFDYTEMDRWLSYVLDERHGNAFNVGYACWQHSVMANLPAIDRATGKKIRIKTQHLSPEYVENYTHFLRDYCAYLKVKGWFGKAYHQMIDEPRGNYLDTVKRLHRLSHDAVPDLKVLITACWPPRLPEDSVDIWVPLTPKFKPDDAPRLKANGDETWWYVCCSPMRPYANFFIDYPAIDHRILFWQSWKYGAQGILYWGLNYWTRGPRKGGVNWPVTDAERWPNGPWVPNPYARINGDGYSMYPGPDGAPLSSVRLEVIRDGLEDYEYLYMLDQLAKRLKAKGAPSAAASRWLTEAERLLAVDDSIAESMTAYTDDPSRIFERRRQIADAIERGIAAQAGAR